MLDAFLLIFQFFTYSGTPFHISESAADVCNFNAKLSTIILRNGKKSFKINHISSPTQCIQNRIQFMKVFSCSISSSIVDDGMGKNKGKSEEFELPER